MNQTNNIKDCHELGCGGQMIEKCETGRSIHYLDVNGNSGFVPEKMYQCRKCKEIQIITDYNN